MKGYLIPALILFLCATEGAAQKKQKNLTVPTDPDPAGGFRVALCCTPSDLFRSSDVCTHKLEYPAGGKDSLSISVKNLCVDLVANATIVALDGRWYISRKANPSEALFLIDCQSGQAQPLGASPLPAKPPEKPPAPAAQGQTSASNGKEQEREKEKVPEKLQTRLREMEDALARQKSAVQSLQEELKKRGAAERDLEKKLESFQKDLLERVRALEEGQKSGCARIEDRHQGTDEVMITVAGSVLRFLRVKPRESAVPIGLSDAKAGEFLAEVQAQDSRPIFPHVYLAVPEAFREVDPFFLQDRLIDPFLYSRLTEGKDAKRVSYKEVTRFIADLNARCSGLAKFALPTEEQLVAAAHSIYDPVANGLRPCEALRKEDLRSSITELFGSAWQLTRSPCRPFGDPPKESCPENSYVRKGGAASSTNPLECMPEYRSPAPSDVNQKETSFRLALVE